ncbi:transcriptional repressor proteinral negative regulator of transcription subunit 4 [Sporothrix epigloea]|uniref:Transcriptional repressor proteinral negative regulator of transcription subunit 4 n=1 Tax=Sporothrix epigloea TaxID=1892477 RepID=A0ABP0DE05_9PEZI
MIATMDDVVSTVDALVSDDPVVASYHYGIDSPLRSGTPSFPPGFGHIQPLQYPTPPPPPGFSRPMTPAASTPTNPSSLLRLQSSTSVMSLTDLKAHKQTQDAPEQHTEQQRQALNLPGKKETSRIASGSTNASGINVSATESTKLIRTVETAASSTLPDHEASVPATPISKSAKKDSLIQDEDFPALDATAMSAAKPSAAAIQARSSKPSTPVRKKTTEKRPAPTVLNLATKTRPILTKDIEASPLATDKYTTADSVAFPSLPTPSPPLSPVVRSMPQHKTLRVVQASKADFASAGPATLSILAADNAKSAVSTSSTPITTPAALANRQPSALLANRPSTPASEIVSISDNASVVSASISASRAGSPPPINSRIGSAAVRTTTKSQQRKQRKQATKIDVAAVVEAATTTSSAIVGPSTNEQEEDAEIVPIMGRKKKQKKEKPVSIPARTAETNATIPESAPTKSTKEQKETKGAKQIHVAKKDEPSNEKSAAAEPQTTKTAETNKSPPKKSADSTAVTATAPTEGPAAAVAAAAVATASASSATAATTLATESPARRPGPMQDLFEKEQELLQVYLREAAELSVSSTLGVKESSDNHSNGHSKGIIAMDQWARLGGTVHSVVQKMVARGLIDQNVDNIPLLQPFTRLSSPRDNNRQHPIQGDALLPPDVLFQKEDVSDILSGKVVRKHVDGVRILVTPNGDCLRNLTEAEEERFLALQSLVGKSMTSLLSYKCTRYDESDGFALLFKRAISCGLPSYYPVKPKFPPGTTGHRFDPLSKIQREEALYWINQYVLPRLNLLPQSEAASWQSMLMDTGVPQAIGSTTLAPWIYHSPEKLCSVFTDATSSETPADSDATSGHARDVVRVDGVSSPYPTRYSSRFGPTAGRDSIDMRKDLDSSVNAMTVEDAERSLIEARREVKVFERALMQLIKINEMLLKNDDQPAQLALGPDGRTGSGSGSGSGSGTGPVASPAPVAATAY